MSNEHTEKKGKMVTMGTSYKETRQYLLENRWEERNCGNCGSDYFAKGNNQTKTCGREQCTGYEFLEKTKKKTFLGVEILATGFDNFFKELKYKKSDPMPIVNDVGSTLFAGTGGQILDRMIFLEERLDEHPKFVCQSVIRLQGKDLVSVREGFSTSFVNLATEQINPTVGQHIKHLDNWLTFISKMGIFMGDSTIRIVSDNPVWGTHEVNAITTKIYYGGLEIGVANYFSDIAQESRGSLTMSDISFGLERILWGLNKTPAYFDVIGPLEYSVKGDFKRMDNYRTSVLMAAGGVVPSNKDRGSKLRASIKNVSSRGDSMNNDLVSYYYKWWSRFNSFPNSVSEVMDLVSKERDRNINLEMKEELGVRDAIPVDLSVQTYIDEVLRSGIQFGTIRDYLKRKK